MYPNTIGIQSWIDGPIVVCPGQPATYILKTNCSGASNIVWEYSYTGFQWNSFYGGTSYTHNVSLFVPGEKLFIRVKFSFNGQYHNTYRISEIDFQTPCIVYKKEPQEINMEDQVSVYPNPSNGVFRIQIKSEENANFDAHNLEVYDIFGKKVISKEISMPNPGITEIEIDLSGNRKGIYWLKIKNEAYAIEKL